MDAGAAPVTLFYSYAHDDETLRDELQGHLKLLERRGLLAPWHDRGFDACGSKAPLDTRRPPLSPRWGEGARNKHR